MIEFIVVSLFAFATINAAVDATTTAYTYVEPKVQELKTEACQKYNCDVLKFD